MNLNEAETALRAAAKDACLDYARRLFAEGKTGDEVMNRVATYMQDQLLPWFEEAIGNISRTISEPTAPTHRLQ